MTQEYENQNGTLQYATFFTKSLRLCGLFLRLFDFRFSIVRVLVVMEMAHGLALCRTHIRVFRRERRSRPGLRKAKGAAMSWIYLLSGLVAALIFIYLLVALFFPEKF
jgi:K+-transporting ATPase KdpF subunit